MNWKQYLALSISGISFWFFLGFPFANYHESYGWIAQFNTITFSDFVFQTIGHYSSYRPLGQITAGILYKLFNDSIIPIQLFNYCLTILSFLILTSVIKEKKSLSAILAIIGGFFIMGFIYLFHLKGLYYSPLLLLISLLIYYYNKSFSLHNLFICFSIAMIASLFHPFAIFIFIFYIIGISIEKRELLLVKHYILGLLFILIGIGVLNILVPNQSIYLGIISITDFLNIYNALDMNPIMSFISVFLSIITIMSIKTSGKLKNYFYITILLLSVLFNCLSVPVIIAWFLSSIIKMATLKKWTLVFLITVTFSFPFFIGLESRHLYYLVVIICAYTVPLNWDGFERKLYFIDGKLSIIFFLFIISLSLIIKQDLKIPIIPKIVRPLLIEKEKTYQLEEIITWLMKSEYKGYNLSLVSEYPVSTKLNPKSKIKQRIPTSNNYLNDYLNSIRSHNVQQQNQNLLFVCFENHLIENAELIYFVTGEWSGKASVFVPIVK